MLTTFFSLFLFFLLNLHLKIHSKDELLKFLSLCRMLHWPQVHWLKVFAVMVGSLNNVISDIHFYFHYEMGVVGGGLINLFFFILEFQSYCRYDM